MRKLSSLLILAGILASGCAYILSTDSQNISISSSPAGAQLKGRVGVALDVHRRLFGLQEKLSGAANAEAVIRRLCRSTHFHRGLVDHILVGLRAPFAVVDVPTEGFEKGVDEFGPHLGLIVGAGPVGLKVVVEPPDQLQDVLGCRHVVGIPIGFRFSLKRLFCR